MGTGVLSTGDKILNVMKEEEIGIAELSRMSGMPEGTVMDILAGIREPEFGAVCRIADGTGVCALGLYPNRKCYAIPVENSILAKLIVLSGINGVGLEELVHAILEKGIEENGFYD